MIQQLSNKPSNTPSTRRSHLLMRCALWLSLCTAGACSAQTQNSDPGNNNPQALQALAAFMKTTHNGRAHFTQLVTSPAKEGRPARQKKSEGTFSFLRPQRFRFEYDKPFAQTIVADGQTLWLYDPDIAQVTARVQSVALGSTPASLIASAPDLSVLEKDFTLSAQTASPSSALQWVIATPRAQDSQLQQVRVGLNTATEPVQLSTLEILDAFGQKSVITFDRFEVNASSVSATSFKFTPPPGVETIRP